MERVPERLSRTGVCVVKSVVGHTKKQQQVNTPDPVS